MDIRCLAPLSLLLCGFAAWADDARPASSPAEPPPAIGQATQSILDLQRSGAVAGEPRPMQGEVAARAQQRYLDAFNRPMPGTSGNSGGAGSSMPAVTTK